MEAGFRSAQPKAELERADEVALYCKGFLNRIPWSDRVDKKQRMIANRKKSYLTAVSQPVLKIFLKADDYTSWR